ncbi:hypothetical protein M3J09_006319 [Ascochyta lentis]
MGDSYNSGHDQGYLDGSLSNMITPNCYDAFAQQALINQNTQSYMTRSRHDSVNSQLSPQVTQYSAGQYQAETQPRAAQLTSPTGTEAMSRGASHASYRSSTSSGQQYGSPHFVQHNSFPSMWPSNGPDMQRSRSMYSNTSTTHSHHVSPQLGASQAYQPYINSHYPKPMDALATNLPIAAQDHSPDAQLNESASAYISINATEVELLGFGIGDIGHNVG